MQDKKIIILIVVGALGIISLIYGITTPTKARREASIQKESSYDIGKTRATKEIGSVKRRAKRTHFTTWRRRPFMPQSSGVASSPMKLYGIVGSAKNPKAMINGTIVTVGDAVEGSTVVEITPHKVVLSGGGKRSELLLKE